MIIFSRIIIYFNRFCGLFSLPKELPTKSTVGKMPNRLWNRFVGCAALICHGEKNFSNQIKKKKICRPADAPVRSRSTATIDFDLSPPKKTTVKLKSLHKLYTHDDDVMRLCFSFLRFSSGLTLVVKSSKKTGLILCFF